MGFIRCQIFSPLLHQHTSLCVAFPANMLDGKTKFPVLYLLHGGTEDSTIWFREANIEALAEKYGVFIASLDAMSSSYADMIHGLPYFSYLTQELPRLLRSRLPISHSAEGTYIAGLSMGGQGALKAAFRRPEQYAACISISGARDMVPLYKQWESMENGPNLAGVIDAVGPIDKIYGSENDLLYLAKKAVDEHRSLPAVYLACGDQDYARALSDDYHEYLVRLGLHHDYYVGPGTHSYTFGEAALDRALHLIWKGRCTK